MSSDDEQDQNLRKGGGDRALQVKPMVLFSGIAALVVAVIAIALPTLPAAPKNAGASATSTSSTAATASASTTIPPSKLNPPLLGTGAPTTVPNVVGKTLNPVAYQLLANFYIIYRLEYSDTVPAGDVIVQSPAPGSNTPAQSAVNLGVSMGPATIAGAQPCQAANLQVAPGTPVSAATQTNPLAWTFTNKGEPCLLDGYPTITASDKNGQVLAYEYSHSGDQMVTGAPPQKVYLPTGGTAYVGTDKITCNTPGGPQDTSSSFSFGLPAGGGTLTATGTRPDLYGYCPRGQITIAVSPFEPVEMTMFSQAVPVGPLSVQIGASPLTAVPGKQLKYIVTVTNVGIAPLSNVSAKVVLPDYVQRISWPANCQGPGPDFTCTVGGTGTSPPPGPQAQLQSGQSQVITFVTKVNASPAPQQKFLATVTVTATAASGALTCSAKIRPNQV